MFVSMNILDNLWVSRISRISLCQRRVYNGGGAYVIKDPHVYHNIIDGVESFFCLQCTRKSNLKWSLGKMYTISDCSLKLINLQLDCIGN